MVPKLHQGDCLEIMRGMPDNSVDAVVTDPPYGINTRSDGMGKLSPWADLTNAAFWYSEWMREARRLLKPDGAMWTFLNWRSIVTFQKASCDIRWPIESLLVWDKCWIGPGGQRGLRPSYELVALFMNEQFAITDRSIPDIQRYKWSSHKPNGHPAEKPQALIEFLVKLSTQKNGIVLDMFMGSGTTGAACKVTEREFIGIELDPEYFKIAEARINAEPAQQELPMLTEAL